MKRTIATILLTLLAFATVLFAGPAVETVQWEGVRYRLYGKAAADREALREFHALFRKHADEVYAMHGVRPPLTTDIALAGNADIFRQLSGEPWFVAGLYDARTDRLILQRPRALQQRGLLVSTIRHEVCHRLLAGLRRENSGSSRPWLEEGYCESVGRLTAPDCRSSASWMKATARLSTFETKLSAGLKSENRTERRRAFCIGAEFANFLVNTHGRPITLDMVLAQRPVPPESFKQFRAKFR